MDKGELAKIALRELIVDSKTGEVYRAVSKQRPDLVGLPAGYEDNCGYVRVSIGGCKVLRSHITFLFATGKWPTKKIDHINRIRNDDRPENLREATHHQNMWNRTPKTRELPMGVTFRNGKFEANIMCFRKLHRLGRFATVEQANDAYQTKRKELFHEYA